MEADESRPNMRAMSDEQLDLTLKDTIKNLFHLRFQSATDRLETPSEIQQGQAATSPGSRRSSASASSQPTKQAAAEGATQAWREQRQPKSRPTERGNAGASSRRRHQRQDEQDPPRRDPAAGQASAVRQVHQAADDLLRPRREERVAHRRHGRDHGDAGRCPRPRTGGWCASSTKAPGRGRRPAERPPADATAASVTRGRPRQSRHSTKADRRHDSDVYLPRRGRQHRRQGVHVHQGAGRHAGGATPAWAT